MTVNLRELVEEDLGESIEKEWGVSCTFISPDGEIDSDVKCQALNFTQQEDPETGETVVVNKPVIVPRISSLARVPLPGERWMIQYPSSPVSGASTIDGMFSAIRAPEDGTDIGFMRMYPQDTEQES